MKKTILLLMIVVVYMDTVYAQDLYITNSTCTGINLVLYGRWNANPACGRGQEVDFTNNIYIPAGGAGDIQVDFSGGAYSPSVVAGSIPSPFWVNGTGLGTGWEFSTVEFLQECGGTISTCDGHGLNGLMYTYCPPSGLAQDWVVDNTCTGNTCDVCPANPTPYTLLHVIMYKSGADTYVEFY